MPTEQTLETMPLVDFIARPDTAAFIIRYNALARNYIAAHPYLRIGKTLTGDYAIGYVQRDRFPEILNDLGTFNIDIFPLVCGLLARPELDASGITAVQQQPFLDLRGSGVLIGFIDTGIDYTQRAFQYEDGTTKIKYIWDQTIRGNFPEGFNLGAEYTEEQINTAINSADPYSVVPHRDTVGHGTFLASVAAGRERGPYIGAAPDSELIIVKLKKASPFYTRFYLVPPDQENVYETSDLMLGIDYIIEKATELRMPVAICISVGTNLGGHDGSNVLEEFLARISHIPGIAVCASAGNESAQRHHTHGLVARTGDVKNIEITVRERSSSVFISLWNGPTDRMSVSVRSPAGEVVESIPAKSGTTLEQRLILEQSTVNIQYFFPVGGTGDQLTAIRIINPTSGIWTIRIHGDFIVNGRYNAWLPLIGLGPPEINFLPSSPNYTICVPATSIGVITCGAYDTFTDSLYYTSSWGPTRLPSVSPDLAAPGVNVGGIFPLGYGRMSGTSVAAAITTGACALLLQWGFVQRNETSISTFWIKTALIRGCERDPGVYYPNVQWGYGKLNLLNTFRLLRRF